MSQQVIHELLGAALVSPRVVETILKRFHPRELPASTPPKYKLVFQVIWSCTEDQVPITKGEVIKRLQRDDVWEKDGLTNLFLTRLMDDATSLVLEAAPHHADYLRRAWQADRTATELEQAAAAIRSDPEVADQTWNASQAKVATIWSKRGSTLRDGSAKAILAEKRARGDAPKGIPCGLKFIDWLTRGLVPSHYWVIAAAQKGRKTTITRQIAIRLCRNGIPVTFYTTEGTREILFDGLVAMLATMFMRQQWKVQHCKDPQSPWGPNFWQIRSEGMDRNLRTNEMHEAITWAEEHLNNLSTLTIRDASDGIIDLNTLVDHMRVDKAEGRCQIAIVDHLQNIEVPGHAEVTKTVPIASKKIRNTTVEKGITTLMISQRSEAANKDPKSATVGTHGGGQPIADADYILGTVYNNKQSPSKLKIEMLRSRWSGSGSIVYHINPSSGLIFDPLSMPAMTRDEQFIEDSEGRQRPSHQQEGHEEESVLDD